MCVNGVNAAGKLTTTRPLPEHFFDRISYLVPKLSHLWASGKPTFDVVYQLFADAKVSSLPENGLVPRACLLVY